MLPHSFRFRWALREHTQRVISHSVRSPLHGLCALWYYIYAGVAGRMGHWWRTAESSVVAKERAHSTLRLRHGYRNGRGTLECAASAPFRMVINDRGKFPSHRAWASRRVSRALLPPRLGGAVNNLHVQYSARRSRQLQRCGRRGCVQCAWARHWRARTLA